MSAALAFWMGGVIASAGYQLLVIGKSPHDWITRIAIILLWPAALVMTVVDLWRDVR